MFIEFYNERVGFLGLWNVNVGKIIFRGFLFRFINEEIEVLASNGLI